MTTRSLFVLLFAFACGESSPAPDFGVDGGPVDGGHIDAAPAADAGWPPTCEGEGDIVCGWRPDAPAIPVALGSDGFFHGPTEAGPAPYARHRLDPADPWGEVERIEGTESDRRPWLLETEAGLRMMRFTDGVLTLRDLEGTLVESVAIDAPRLLAVYPAGDEIVVELPGERGSRLAVYRAGELRLQTDDGTGIWVWPRLGGRPLLSRYDFDEGTLVAGELGETPTTLDTSACDEPLGEHALLSLEDGGLAWVFRCGGELFLSTRDTGGAAMVTSIGGMGRGPLALVASDGALIVVSSTRDALRVQALDERTHERLGEGELPLLYVEEYAEALPLSSLVSSRVFDGVLTMRAELAPNPLLYASDVPTLAVCEICAP